MVAAGGRDRGAGGGDTMRGLLAAVGALTMQQVVHHATASDITLTLDMSAFGLDTPDEAGGDGGGDGGGGGGGGGGGAGGLMGSLVDDSGGLIIIDNGTPNSLVLSLTTLVPIPATYQDVLLEEATMHWFSPNELAYSLNVSLVNTAQHTNAGWIAEEIMTVPELSVPTSGRLPSTRENVTVSLTCITPGKARVQFEFHICEDASAIWQNDGCTVGDAQLVDFIVDKECGDSNALPDFCTPASPPAVTETGESASVKVFNLNVAEGAGIDRTKLIDKGNAIAAVIAEEGSDVACLQEVWDEGERAALTDGLANSGLSHSVTARGAGLLIASRFPILRCGVAAFPADTYGGTIESFAEKGVLGALLDIGGGALLYVFVTHMTAFSGTSGSQAQLEIVRHEIENQISEAAAVYGPSVRIGAVAMGDFNLNAADEEVKHRAPPKTSASTH